MAKKYTLEIKEKVLQYLQDGKSYGEIKKETGISKTTIWIWKQKAKKNELKTKHSANSAPRDIANKIMIYPKIKKLLIKYY